MRNIKLLFVTLLLIAFGLVLNAQAAPELSPEGEGKINLGTSTEGQLKRGSFKITNTGNSKLVINHYMTTCSCLEITKSVSRDLAPGESGEFRFVFDTTGIGDKESKKELILFSNDPESPHRVTITTRVQKPAKYQAGSEEILDDFTVLVDLRSPDSFDSSHILGAVNVPAERLKNWAINLPEDITLYLYSKEGDISDRLAERLNPELPVKLKSLIGGFVQWQLNHEGYLVKEE